MRRISVEYARAGCSAPSLPRPRSPRLAAQAAEPYEINTILSLTGNIAFVGSTQLQSLKALEAHGQCERRHPRPAGLFRRLRRSVERRKPPCSSRKDLIAKNVPIILGSSGPNACGAIAPLVAANGPVLYCLANGGDPVIGRLRILDLMSYDSQLAVAVRYFRERGWQRIATIFATDAGGQGVREGAARRARPAREQIAAGRVAQHFAPGDASVAAQMAVIKGANPDALVAWATGGAAGTLFRGAQDIGLDLPTVTSPGNLTGAFLKQYAAAAAAAI